MKSIVLTSSKGGSGKTTFAVHFAAALALRGKRVLLVDTDTQGHCAIAFGLAKRGSLSGILSADLSWWQTSYQYPDDYRSLRIIASDRSLLRLPADLPPDILRTRLSEIAGDFDACLIDTAPSPGELLEKAYRAADYAIVPTKLQMFDLDGVIATIHDLARAHVPLAGIIPNMVKNTAVCRYNFVELQGFAAHNHLPLWTPVAERTAWGDAAQARRMVWAQSPRSKAVAEVRALVDCVEALL